MILIIDNYDSFTYNLYQMVAKTCSDVKVVRNDELTVSDIETLAPEAIILSPGPGRPEDAGVCVELIEKLAPTTPILGICLGHQAIGLAFGGKITSADNIVHGKPSQLFHRRQGIFKGMPLPFSAGRYHSLVVEKRSLPKALQVEAMTDSGVIMAIKHEKYPCYGLQFHPESILTPHGALLIQNFLIEAKQCSKN